MENDWKSVDEGLPDSDTMVLIACKEGYSEPVWMGYHDGETWRDVEATDLQNLVTHWRDLPEEPRKAQARKKGNERCKLI